MPPNSPMDDTPGSGIYTSLGYIHGKVEAMEKAVEVMEEQQLKLFQGQTEILKSIDNLTAVTSKHSQRTEAAVQELSKSRAEVESLKREVDTTAVRRKVDGATPPGSSRADAMESGPMTINEAFSKGASNAIVKIIEYSIVFALLGGAWLIFMGLGD